VSAMHRLMPPVPGSDPRAAAAVADAEPVPYWHDRRRPRVDRLPVAGTAHADLVVVGGGFTGLWAALLAKESQPQRHVVVLEGERIAHGATGRNGGFIDASLTHGLDNGIRHWPGEIATLLRLGDASWEALIDTIERYAIPAAFEPVGAIEVALEPWQVAKVELSARLHQRYGRHVEVLSRDQVQHEVASPTYLAGAWHRTGRGLVDPVGLADGLAAAAESLGVVIHERSPVSAIEVHGAGVRVDTPGGRYCTNRVVLATNAYRPPIAGPRRYVAPVYDYVLVTEPLRPDQTAALRWRNRQGVSEAGNQFHYYRLTPDNRILWGGYDALYHFGNRVEEALAQCDASHRRLAGRFLETFPELDGVRFTHRWGGPIATTSRFTAAFGTSHGGRVAWAAGYTGLGVAASRFGAQVALDLLEGDETERTRTSMVRRKPFPFPPEPLRWASIEMTRRAIAGADADSGRRGPWLRLLDRLGVGFDS
jgi:glycine/D-amino acid oxidase-like deaminating enzyme